MYPKTSKPRKKKKLSIPFPELFHFFHAESPSKPFETPLFMYSIHSKRFYRVYRRPSKEKGRRKERKKKKNRESRGTGLGPIGPHGDLRLFLVSLFGGRTAP